MRRLLLKTAGLFILAFIVFLAHRYLLFPAIDRGKIAFLNFSYLFNLGATVFIVLSSFFIGCFTKRYLGFLFMILSVLKIVVFVVLTQKLGFILGKIQVLQFFIPYAMGLTIDIFFLTRQLNRGNSSIVKDLD